MLRVLFCLLLFLVFLVLKKVKVMNLKKLVVKSSFHLMSKTVC